MTTIRGVFVLAVLLAPHWLAAENCLTVASKQEMGARTGKRGSTFVIEVAPSSKPSVTGNLSPTIGYDNQSITFTLDVPSEAKVTTQTEGQKLVVCVVAADATVTSAAETAVDEAMRPVPASARMAPGTPPASPATAASAEPAVDNSGASQAINFASVDLGAPESPAFTVLGLTPQTVVRPNTPQELATTLINGIDNNGNFQTGVAFDTAPYMLFFGDGVTLRDYNDSRAIRFVSRFQVSGATTKGTSDSDKAVRASLGFRATIWDEGDPRTDRQLMECFAEKLTIGFPIPPGPMSEDTRKRIEKREQELEPIAEQCRQESQKRNWNASSWIVAGAPAWISPDGTSTNFRYDGGGFWTSFAYGFKQVPGLADHAQLILHARYRDNETVPDPASKGAFFRQDSTAFGGRMRFGTEGFNGDFEGVYVSDKPVGKLRDSYARYTFGVEKRLASSLWLNVSVSRDAGRTVGGDNISFFSNFKWNFSPKPTMQFPSTGE